MVDPQEKAMDVQEKLELYLLSLAFTLLALSVQTASFGTHPIGDTFELLGWGLLLISGITGILRLQHVPVALRYYAAKQQNIPIDEEDLKKVEAKIASRKYLWFFISGLVFVILARTVSPLSQVVSFLS